MSFDVVIPWRGGCPHRARAWTWVLERWATLHSDAELVITASPEGPFNIAAALNIGIRGSRSDVVVLSGADVILDPSDVADAVDLASDGRWVMLAGEYRRLSEDITAEVLDGPVDAVWDWPGEEMDTDLGWGPIVAPRELLLDVGYDERFLGWGGEDDAFGIAAETLAGSPLHLGGTAYMLWHPPATNTRYAANVALLNRYRSAHHCPSAIRALLAER